MHIVFEAPTLHGLIAQMQEFIASTIPVVPPGYGIERGLNPVAGYACNQVQRAAEREKHEEAALERARQFGFSQGYERGLLDGGPRRPDDYLPMTETGPDSVNIQQQSVQPILPPVEPVPYPEKSLGNSCSSPEAVARALRARPGSHRLGMTDD
jgi:hypothetical protein